MTDRHTVDSITSDHLDALYARIETLEHVAAGNKRHVQAIVPELEQAWAAIKRVREAIGSLQRTVAHDPRDWGQDKRDAWIWGIVCGWECEEQHDHDAVCGRNSALREVAARHQWANEDVDRLKTYRRALAALDKAAPAATEATEPANSALRDLIAGAIYERNNPGRRWADAHPDDRVCYGSDADAAITVIAPGARITATLAREAEAGVTRVIALHEQWVKAGPPPLGTSTARWWDARLVELHNAIQPPQPEPSRCCGKPPEAICVHDVTPPADQTTEK